MPKIANVANTAKQHKRTKKRNNGKLAINTQKSSKKEPENVKSGEARALTVEVSSRANKRNAKENMEGN